MNIVTPLERKELYALFLAGMITKCNYNDLAAFDELPEEDKEIVYFKLRKFSPSFMMTAKQNYVLERFEAKIACESYIEQSIKARVYL